MRVSNILAALLFATAGVGCADAGKSVRKLTYPPELRYYEKAEIDEAMLRLSKTALQLDRLLSAQDATSPEKQSEVLRLLDEMSDASNNLSRSSSRPTHPLFDSEHAEFQTELRAARESAALEPPNYYQAGAIIGSCQRCHGG